MQNEKAGSDSIEQKKSEANIQPPKPPVYSETTNMFRGAKCNPARELPPAKTLTPLSGGRSEGDYYVHVVSSAPK